MSAMSENQIVVGKQASAGVRKMERALIMNRSQQGFPLRERRSAVDRINRIPHALQMNNYHTKQQFPFFV